MIGGTWQVASVVGTLRHEGWGVELGEEGSEVRGFLFSSENLAEHWKALDEFEDTCMARIHVKLEQHDCWQHTSMPFASEFDGDRSRRG